jgi:hypothetical protein
MIQTPVPQQPPDVSDACDCKKCHAMIPFVARDMINDDEIYCAECSMAEGLTKKYSLHWKDTFWVFIYALPDPLRFRDHARERWIPPDQALNSSGWPHSLPRRVYQQALPGKLLFARISVAVAKYEKFPPYENVSVLIGGEGNSNFLCAYVAERSFIML